MKLIMKSLIIAILLISNILSMRIDNNKSYSPIDHALLMFVKNNNIDSTLKALELGADINAQNTFGKTALMLACQSGNLDLISLLLQQNPDLTIQDALNKTALDYATQSPNFSQIKETFSNHLNSKKTSLAQVESIEEDGGFKLIDDEEEIDTDSDNDKENFQTVEQNQSYIEAQDINTLFALLDDEQISLSESETESKTEAIENKAELEREFYDLTNDYETKKRQPKIFEFLGNFSKKENNFLTCDFKNCKFKTKYTIRLTKHTKEVHNTCTYPSCAKTFTSKSKLDLHIKRIHKKSNSPERFTCDRCGFSSRRSNSLENHKIKKHIM